MKSNIKGIRFLFFTFLLCTGMQVNAQEYQSFDKYNKAEKARLKKYQEDEKRNFEAFKKNELDWNNEILGYKVETPVSVKVDVIHKESVVKPAPPHYVDLTASLSDELVQIKRKINKLLVTQEQQSQKAISLPKTKGVQAKEEGLTVNKNIVGAKTNKNPVESKVGAVEEQSSNENVDVSSTKGASIKDNKSPKINKESLIEAEKRNIPSTKPIYANYRLSSKFGNRFHPLLFRWRFHGGVDMACPKGTEVHVPADGVVIKSGWNNGYGNYIKVKHSNGFETVYGHLSKIKIKKGQKVSKGDVIGEVGSTGRSTGPHLHYEILKNSKRVNPQRFFG